jgi:hypothetical protein
MFRWSHIHKKRLLKCGKTLKRREIYGIHATQIYAGLELLQIDVTVEDDRRRQSIPTAVVVRRHQAFYDGKLQKIDSHAFEKLNYEFGNY